MLVFVKEEPSLAKSFLHFLLEEVIELVEARELWHLVLSSVFLVERFRRTHARPSVRVLSLLFNFMQNFSV